VQELGNYNYKNGGSIELVDYNAGKQVIAEILVTEYEFILMCACKDVAICHRLTAAAQLATDLRVPITNLVLPKKRPTQEAQGRLFAGSDGTM
jgi:hypothetical protein